MNLLESIIIALEGLSANKLRSALTMLGVIIGVGAVIAMLAIATGAREQTMQRIQQMGTNVLIIMSGQSRAGAVRGGFGSSQTLTLDDAAALTEKCPSIVKSAPQVQTNLQVKYRNQNTNTQVTGVTPDFLDVRNYAVLDGKFFTAGDVKSMKKVATIGQTTAANLFGTTSPVGKEITIRGIRFTIIGLMASKGASGGFQDADDVIFIPISTAMRRVIGTQYVRMISAQARSMSVMDQATSEISAVLRKRHRLADSADDDFITRNQAEFMQMADQTSQVFTLLLAGIASVSLLVGGIGIMNIMLVSVTERTREIGIRMALGARRRDILLQFLIESLVLSLLGGIIGILAGLGGSMIMESFGWSIAVSIPSIVMSFTFSALIGVFFGLYPAFQASRLDPIDALRYE